MSSYSAIERNVRALLEAVPEGVTVVGAVKTRSPDEVRAAVGAGLRHIGHNYVQEAEAMRAACGFDSGVVWHGIGHIQRRKARKSVQLFDLVETVDSIALGLALQRAAEAEGKALPVLVEVNSGVEEAKAGVHPDQALDLIRSLVALPNLRVQGLMTLGPADTDAEGLRAAFRLTRQLFEAVASVEGAAPLHLSMGMSSSWEVAVEEGATSIRVGTSLFGARAPRGVTP
ncbi:MAG: YggS family pyridoxal phosphate-dependent enzyme [Deltaproteobacteria bacterium]|nr:YggS family pyridoxal phosphate-dependent enzyme [Deltaproteobacteria bacterium]